MYKVISDLFPICRSITGPGIKKSLKYFEIINPKFKRIKFKTGKKIFDWVIPKEWSIRDGFIQDIKSKKKYAKFKDNNLHILNFSSPINKTITKKELFKHIFTIKEQPKAIPYVTSYYKKNWGFCLSEREKNKLNNKNYRVFIDSKFTKGHLDLSHAIFRGKSQKEIFFSSYLCHPSMANNELSGPAVISKLADYISKKKKLRFTYRFVLLPETIGSICYINKFKKTLKRNMICGFNVSCVGDDRHYSIISSREGNSLADISLLEKISHKKNFTYFSYLQRGSDERQYCAPGIDLPICGFSRTKYGEYKEYHTSEDNLNLVNKKSLQDSFNVLKSIVDSFEDDFSWYSFPKSKFYCEPNLGKRKLYPNVSEKKNYHKLNLRMDLIAYSDGKKNLVQISKIIKKPIKKILVELKILVKKKVLIF